MTSNNDYKTSGNQANEANTTKVYINPNFQKNHGRMQYRSMHINPLFPQLTLPTNNKNKPKIYINPNFVNKSNLVHNMKNNQNEAVNISQFHIPSTSTSTLAVQKTEFQVPQDFANLVAKSRYSLVRHNNAPKMVTTQRMDKVVTTYKINKYKLVSIEKMKNNMETKKLIHNSAFKSTTLIAQAADTKKKYIPLKDFQSRFKIKRNSVITPIKTDYKSPVVRRRFSQNNLNISRTKLKINQKIKIDRTKLKKNNIPCPLFKKYGKCLRNTQGNCEFLHDKKHVAICRKFLKGICHDRDCLLSHEVTAEKMPTCFFYLRGMCTKEDCPYLHVKLNEKAKICTDFLKGYCDKGDACLNRHFNICPEAAASGVCHRKLCPYPHKSNSKFKEINKNKVKNKFLYVSIKRLQKEHYNPKLISSEENRNEVSVKEIDHRYYKVVESSSPETETIKPTRCKLGALPSFIQL